MSEFKIDKSSWPRGPWDGEPDYAEFVAHGLDCEIMRSPRYGHLCGYVHCRHDVPEAGLPEDITGGGVGVYGFDCHHLTDYAPNDTGTQEARPWQYRTLPEVRERTAILAKAIRCRASWWRRLLRWAWQFIRETIRRARIETD